MRKFKGVLGGLAVGLLLIASARSATALNVQLLRPSTGHVQGFQLFTSENLPKYRLATGLNVNFAHHPFELIVVGTTTRTLGIVDRFVTADFLVSYGITDWWSISLDMPVNIYHDIAPTFIATRDRGGGDVGDLALNMKFQIFDANKTSTGLGLAFVPFVTLPTGRQSIFFGDANVTGGGILVGDAQWKSNRFYLNVGGRFREREQVTGLIVKNELLYGLGFQRPLVKKWDFNIILEVFGSTNFRKFAKENISSPVEGLVVLQKKWLENRRLVTNFGGGFGLTNGYGVPTWRAFMGVSYAWDLRPAVKVVEEIIVADVHFPFDKAEILPTSFPLLNEVAQSLRRPVVKGVRVEGHTDSYGSDTYNQKLSERRATSVRGYMIDKGVNEGTIEAVGMGESKPVADNATKEGRAKNRRVEFHLQIEKDTKVKVKESEKESPTYQQGDPGGSPRK